MKTLAQWFEEYGDSHRHPINKRLHWVCVPAIVFSVICALACLRLGDSALNAALPAGALALLFYARLSRPLALGMTGVLGLMYAGALGLQQVYGERLLWIATAIFGLAWIGQFIGHRYERKQPSFFKDLAFLLIGPLWLLADLYRRLRLPTH